MTSHGPYFFRSSFPRTQDQFQGSSFKPLSLAYHPWVRASQREAPVDSDVSIPRLSFLTQYYHLHGQYPTSLENPHEDDNHQTEEAEGEEPACPQSELFEEESATSDASNESNISITIPHLDIHKIGPVTTPALPYVLRPSCSRSSSSSSVTSFASRTPSTRRRCPTTSPDIGLSAFHDMFSMSICPSDDMLFPASEPPLREHRRRHAQNQI